MYHVKEELVYLGVDIAKAYLDAAMGNEKSFFQRRARSPAANQLDQTNASKSAGDL